MKTRMILLALLLVIGSVRADVFTFTPSDNIYDGAFSCEFGVIMTVSDGFMSPGMLTLKKGGATLTFSSDEIINAIRITVVSGDPADRISGDGYVASGEVGVWQGSASTVVLANNASDWVGIQKIEVATGTSVLPTVTTETEGSWDYTFDCSGEIDDSDSLVVETPIATFVQHVGTGSNKPAYVSPWRIYTGNTVTIRMNNDYVIDKVEIVVYGSYSSDEPQLSYSTDVTDFYADEVKTIFLPENTHVLTMANTGAQTRWSKIILYYYAADEQGDNIVAMASPREIDFGMVGIKSKSSKDITIIARKATQITAVDVAEPYSIDGVVLPTQLDVNQSCVLTLCSEPQTEGVFSETLTITLTDTVFSIPITTTASSTLPLGNRVKLDLPKASHFYDFNNGNSKGFAYTQDGVMTITKSQLNAYAADKQLNVYLDNIDYIADINNDGYPDFSCTPYTSGGHWISGGMLLSNAETDYQYRSTAWFLPGLDMNADGKPDYLRYVKSSEWAGSYYAYSNSLLAHIQTANGVFVASPISLLTQADYEATFDPDAWYVNNTSGGIHTVIPGNFGFGGFCGVNCGAGGSVDYTLPTQCMDLDGDGRIDLLDEVNGKLLYTKDQKTAVYAIGGGYMQSCDLNGDGYADFVGFYEGQLISVIYRGNGNYEQTVIFENPVVDNKYYCYDIDKDGDIDLLVTLSYPYNEMASYIVPFLNDGQGNFTQNPETYTLKNLLFKSLQDVNGDGYMDILAFEGDADVNLTKEWSLGTIYVVCMVGGESGQFAEPQRIITITDANRNLENASINAEDLDNDGLIEIWVSGTTASARTSTEIYKFAAAQPNTPPAAPSKPNAHLNNGVLQVTWNATSDDNTSVCDLTYALRIGTAPGKSDVLDGGATPTGSRRGFYDGNMQRNRSYLMDVSALPPGTYYVAVQAVDAQHTGSPWSEEATFEHTMMPNFTIYPADNLTCADTISIYYTQLPDGYTCQWDMDNAIVVSETAECTKITFGSSGTKTISLTVTTPSGQKTKNSKNLILAPNYFDGEAANKGELQSSLRHYADYNGDGYLDVAESDGVYINDGTGTLSKAVALWNSGLNLTRYAWLDYDRNGYMDLIYIGNGISSGVLANNGNGTFSKKVDSNVEALLNSSSSTEAAFGVDWDGDGLPDSHSYEYDSAAEDYRLVVRKNNGDGTFTSHPSDATIPYGTGEADFNRDGRMDAFSYIWTGTGNYSSVAGLAVLLNQGNFDFERIEIPFAEPIMSAYAGYHFQSPCVIDMNADGYLDIVAYRETDDEGAFYILYNRQNTAFSEPVFVPLDNHVKFSLNNGFVFYDIDNNGYLDVVVGGDAPDGRRGWYAVYFDENGAGRQSFLSTTYSYQNWALDMDADGLLDLNGASYGTLRSCVQNQRPEAPSNVYARQTETGLLITWEPANDDYTPHTAMRYNLSVKRKGRTGTDAYIISPMNGGNADMAALPTMPWVADDREPYFYISGTQHEIPLSALTANEELEISVQAVDLWNAMSEFSIPLDYKVGASADISAPANTCVNNVTTISYAGTNSSETPIWDFAGANIVSGSGFGPYEVSWTTEGAKQVRLTLGSETTYTTIYVNAELDATVGIANYVQYNVDTEIVLPQVSPLATFSWQIEIGAGSGFVDLYNNSFGYNAMINAQPGNKLGTVRICRNSEIATRRLQLTVSYNGCESVYQTPVINLIPENEMPKIAYVSPNAGNNVIHWAVDDLPADVTAIRVLKETSYYNDFELLDEVPASQGSYVDVLSNAAVKSERYRIQSMYGTAAGPLSDAHKTVHLTINKAQQAGQFNLIWSGYEGRQVATYHILRGTTPDNLTRLADVSSSSSSYLDMTAGTDNVYYAIEYELYSDAYQQRSTKAAQDYYTGQSNVVCSDNAISTILATSLEIQSLSGLFNTTADNPTLYLLAELFPANTTYKNVQWEIVSGADKATINSNGVLTAKAGNSAGNVIVQATTIDGSEISVTKTIWVASFADEPEVVPVSSINITANQTTLTPAAPSVQLYANVQPGNATNKAVSWEVTDGVRVVSVSETGLVTAISDGSATVRATALDGSGIYGEITLTTTGFKYPDLYIFGDAIPGTSWNLPLVNPHMLTNNQDGTYKTSLTTNGGCFTLVPIDALACTDWNCMNIYQYGPENDRTDISNSTVPFIQTTIGAAFLIQEGTYHLSVDLLKMSISSIGQTGLNTSEKDNCLIYSQENRLVVENAMGEELRVYYATGQLVMQEKLLNHKEIFALPSSGIYVVKAGDTVRRVLIK